MALPTRALEGDCAWHFIAFGTWLQQQSTRALEGDFLSDPIVGRIFFRPFSIPIAKKLAKTGITPNKVTLFSLALAVVASAFFAFGEWRFLIPGAIFAILSAIFDAVDGDLAREKKMQSSAGEWLDSVCDSLRKFLMLAAIAIGQFRVTLDPFVFVLGIAAIGNFFLIETVRMRSQLSLLKGAREKEIGLGDSHLGLIDTFGLLVFIFALANQLYLALVVFTTLPALIWIRQLAAGKKFFAKKTIVGKK